LYLDLYARDSSAFVHQPEAVVFPGTAEEAAKVLGLAHRRGWPVTPRGAGTSLSGGAVPSRGGLALVLTRLNQVLDIDLVAETALVEAGVVNLDLSDRLAPHGYMFPPDPASQRVSTLGGNIAENAGGIKGIKYGLTKHHVLGLEVVLDNGEMTRTGALAEGPAALGPDLTGLFLGSEGTLGLVTKALVKITPLPQAYRTVSAVFTELGRSGRAVSEIIAAGIIPTAMEIMDRRLTQALEDYLHLGFPREAEAVLLIEIDGLGPELEPQLEKIMELCRRSGAVSLKAAAGNEERERLWLARRSGNGALGRLKPAMVVQDVAVPIRRLPDMLQLVQKTAARHEVIIVQMAHAGDGNIHPHLLYHPDDQAEYQRCLAASADIFNDSLALDGNITGEHGIGLEKVEFMDLQFTAEELKFQSFMKKALDPAGGLNPDKILPAAWQPGAAGEAVSSLAPGGSPASDLGGGEIKTPDRPEDAAALIRAAAAAGRKVAILGLGPGSNPAGPGEVIRLSTRNLTRVVSVEPGNLLASVEAGLTPAQVAEALGPTGLYWPVTGLEDHSLGGLVAEGRLGVETMARGPATNWILGAGLVWAGGDLVRSGGPTLKNVCGYDFTRLIWRARGRLGLATDFILKLLPRPALAPVLEYACPTPGAGADLARRIILARLAPEALRLVWDGEPRLMVWLTGFPENVAARETALADLAGGPPAARHEDGFKFWRAHGRKWNGPGLAAFTGSRRAILAWAAAHPGPKADFDLGGGQATVPAAGDNGPDPAAFGLQPEGFYSSGPAYERLKAALDPCRLFQEDPQHA